MNTNGLYSSHQTAPGPDGRIDGGEQRLLSRARLGKTPALSLYPSALCSRRGGVAQGWFVRARRKSRSHEITVRLDHLSQLFTTPSGDPFSDEPFLVSGMDWIPDELTTHTLGRRARTKTTIVLPKGSLDPSLATRVRGAVKRYCQSKIRHNQHALVALRWQRVKALQMGIVFLAGCLLAVRLSQWGRTRVGLSGHPAQQRAGSASGAPSRFFCTNGGPIGGRIDCTPM